MMNENGEIVVDDLEVTQLIEFREKEDAVHGLFGGAQRGPVVDCPSCGRTLLLFVTVLLRLRRPGRPEYERIPMVMCTRCSLGSKWFAYVMSGDRVEPVSAYREVHRRYDQLSLADWDSHGFRDQLPERGVVLKLATEEVRELITRLELEEEVLEDAAMDEREELEERYLGLTVASRFLNEFLPANQIGGLAVTHQGVRAIQCLNPGCTSKPNVSFVASFVGSAAAGIILAPRKFLQVSFWVCRACAAMHVNSS